MTEPVARWRVWGRRVSFLVLLAGVGFLVVRLLQAQPVDVEVDYHLGRARRGLALARMIYRRAGEELRRVEFRYAVRPAPRIQTHRIKVPRGDLRVSIELSYRQRPPRDVGGRQQGRRLLLDRPLIVSGEGRLSIFIAEE